MNDKEFIREMSQAIRDTPEDHKCTCGKVRNDKEFIREMRQAIRDTVRASYSTAPDAFDKTLIQYQKLILASEELEKRGIKTGGVKYELLAWQLIIQKYLLSHSRKDQE